MKFKRFLCLTMAVLLLLSFAGCSVVYETLQEELTASDFYFPTVEDTLQTSSTEGVSAPEETQPAEVQTSQAQAPTQDETLLPEDGEYDDKDNVALYIHQYGHLPSNYITKKEAEALGWPGGSLEPYAPGKCIGGSRFGNYEGLLPEADGRTYTECDIDTMGASSRGAKRIVFSNDGLIYYTDDHYESFELLYGGD